MKLLIVDMVHRHLLGHTEFSAMADTLRLGSATCRDIKTMIIGSDQ